MHHTFCAVKTQPKLHSSQNVKACHFSMNHFSEWHVITFGRFGGNFYVMNAQKLAISAGLRSNFYMLVSQKYGPVQNTTTQNTQQNNQHEIPLPYPPVALLSPSMGRPVAPPTHGAEATKVPKQGIRCRVCAWRGWFPCFGCHTDTPQKSERREGSWPYGQNLMKTHNNQLEINYSGRRDEERGHTGFGAYGETSSHRLGDNWDNKKII